MVMQPIHHQGDNDGAVSRIRREKEAVQSDLDDARVRED